VLLEFLLAKPFAKMRKIEQQHVDYTQYQLDQRNNQTVEENIRQFQQDEAEAHRKRREMWSRLLNPFRKAK